MALIQMINEWAGAVLITLPFRFDVGRPPSPDRRLCATPMPVSTTVSIAFTGDHDIDPGGSTKGVLAAKLTSGPPITVVTPGRIPCRSSGSRLLPGS